METIKLTLVVLAFGLILSQTACSENKQTTARKMELHSSTSELLAQNSTTSPEKVYEIVEVGKSGAGKITDFSFIDDNGQKVSVSSIIKNKYVFLNFWATWCPPCRAEIPAIIELQNEFSAKDLVVIGIAFEKEKALDAAKKKVIDYVKSSKINYINFVASDEIKKELADSYKGIPYIPTTFLANKNSEVFEKIQGGKTKAEFLKSLQNLIK